MELKIFKLNRIRFGEMYDDAKSYLKRIYEQSDQTFSMASPFGQLLQVIIDMGQMIFYYIEDSITELNIGTATRPDSIRGIARTTGHDPVRSIAASGKVRISYSQDADMYGTKLIIPNGTRLSCEENNLLYIIDLASEDIRIEMEPRSYITCNIKQGIKEESIVYTGTGDPLQSFNVNPKGGREIDMNDIKVTVNSEEWKIYDSLYDMSRDTKGCLVKTSLTSGIDVFFGNGYYGKIPQYGDNVVVEFLSTLGSAGNVTNYSSVTFKFVDPCYDLQGNEVDVSDALTVTAETPISFGTDAEPLYLTKLLAPRMSRSFVLANAESYIYFLEKFNYFSYIDAFCTFDNETEEDALDDNVVYLMLVPDINKRKNNSDNYFSVPQKSFLLTAEEEEKIYDILEKSGQKVLNVVNKIIKPAIRRYAMFISIRIFESYSEDLIRSQIVSKVSEYLLANTRRDRLPKSDIVAIVEGIDGVDSVNVWFMSEDFEKYRLGKTSTLENTYSEFDKRFDDFGDIVMKKDELVLIRGGWYDRNNNFIYDSVEEDRPCACTIIVEDVIPKTFNNSKHQEMMKTIK